jgi:MscS family membrane protein
MNHPFWWVEALAGVAIIFGIHYGIKKIISLVHHQGEVKHRNWQAYLDKILFPPLSILIWTLAFVYVFDVMGQHLGFSVGVGYLHPLRKAVAVVCFAWILFRWKDFAQKGINADPHRKVDPSTLLVIGRLSSIAIIILSLLIILQIFGLNTAPLVAFGSIGAASLGFAGKDVIANFCSSMMLNITRPFVVGEEIYLPEKSLQGHVEEVGWFRTLIRDKEKRAVYLPNNFFSTMLLVNISRMTHRRIYQIVRISFEDGEKVSEIVGQIRSLIIMHPRIDRRLPVHVHFQNFGDYSYEIKVEAYCFETEQGRFNAVEQEILLGIKTILLISGVTPASSAALNLYTKTEV